MCEKIQKILLCCSGSVASIKVPLLVEKMKEIANCEIKIVATTRSLHFFSKEDQKLADIKLFQDSDEWSTWHAIGDPVLHIDLSEWADVIVVAPLDANTLSKLALGLSDNLLTCIARAWNVRSGKPFIFCPAMNTHMWEHPITSKHIKTLKDWGYIELPPVSKKLACGYEGIGAMCNVDDIVSFIKTKCG